jgi:hypothetical protein
MKILHFLAISTFFYLGLSCPLFGLEGYVFIAPGGLTAGGFTNGTVHFGGGGEHRLTPRIGVGAEIGAVGSWRNFRSAIGMFSINGSYHFADRGAKFDPFITGGYSLGFRSGTLNFGNFGGGANYWFRERIGFRGEFRDHLHVSDRVADPHYWGFRFGVAFR